MDTVITPATGHVNVSPFGFHRYASQFADIARTAQSHFADGFSPIPYFLYCRSVELVLKAYLSARGMTKAELKSKKNFGHDLCSLYAEAKNRGLGAEVAICSDWETEIGKANEYYNKKGFEYFEVAKAVRGYPELPDLDTLAQMSIALLRSTERLCIEA